ncbi:hypothetical protein [Phyllobacterium pellucidum]|uniref:hypothetical protein n=1 Tax=Phyllobacterium pellucidum TaxID=2740464 RepID=UPI001D15BB38|nr:hypothetical protein [Phyllobacterium sp. T1018]UGY10188.1 hypothetical protein LLE51_003120 [Phyllobacterium sp. T1018]
MSEGSRIESPAPLLFVHHILGDPHSFTNDPALALCLHAELFGVHGGNAFDDVLAPVVG